MGAWPNSVRWLAGSVVGGGVVVRQRSPAKSLTPAERRRPTQLSTACTIDPQACINSRFCEQGVFPLGAVVPQVRENSCKKIHTGSLLPARLPEGFSGWSCDITFPPGKTALPVAVAVKGSGEVYSAWPVSPHVALPPATVYEGGPEQPQP
jgi:hypothetical protein